MFIRVDSVLTEKVNYAILILEVREAWWCATTMDDVRQWGTVASFSTGLIFGRGTKSESMTVDSVILRVLDRCCPSQQCIVSTFGIIAPLLLITWISESKTSWTMWIQWRWRASGAAVSWRLFVEKRNFYVISLKSVCFGFAYHETG